MTLLFKQIYAFLKLLNSESEPRPLALGLACGLILGFSPLLSLQGLVLILAALFFRIQFGAALLSAFFFSFVAYLLDPWTDLLGRWILEAEPLRSLFVTLFNAPLLPMTRFNNSIVMGSALVSFVLVFPAYYLFRFLIIKYREEVLARLKGTRLWKVLSATALSKWYVKYHELYG